MSVVTKIIDPDNGAGTDYTSLNAFDSGYAKDLVTAGEITQGQCRATSGSADTTACSFGSDWTTNPFCYVELMPHPDHKNESGVWDTDLYSLEVSNAVGLELRTACIKVHGLQFKTPTVSADSQNPIEIDYIATQRDVHIYDCIFVGPSTHSYSYVSAIRSCSNGGAGRVVIYNNVIYGFAEGNSINGGILTTNGATQIHYVFNNTVYDANTAYYNGSGIDMYVYNNIAQETDNYGFNDSSETFLGEDYNISDQASDLSGAHSQNSVTLTFTNVTNKDFSLASTDTEAIYTGKDLRWNQPFPVYTDIIGAVRSIEGRAFCIGAFQYSGKPCPGQAYDMIMLPSGKWLMTLLDKVDSTTVWEFNDSGTAGILIELTFAATNNALTPNIIGALLRNVSLEATNAVSTTDLLANLLRNLAFVATNNVTTTNLTETTLRNLSAAITNNVTTTDLTTAILRNLELQATNNVTTPDILGTLLRNLNLEATNEVSTTDLTIQLLHLISLTFQATNNATSTDLIVAILRNLNLEATNEVSTTDLTIQLLHLIELSMQVTNNALTPDIVATLKRNLILIAENDSSTTDLLIALIRALTMTVTNECSTTDLLIFFVYMLSLAGITVTDNTDKYEVTDNSDVYSVEPS